MSSAMPPLRDLAALYATGALTREERARFLARLDAAPPDERDECAHIQNTAALLLSGVMPTEVPEGTRAAILRRAAAVSTDQALPGFSFVAASEGWKQSTSLPGIWTKELAIDDDSGSVTLLARLAPKTAFPAHDHSGPEQTFVLSGDLQSGGRTLGPGDFFFAARGSHHPDLYSEGGCTALLIVDVRDYARL